MSVACQPPGDATPGWRVGVDLAAIDQVAMSIARFGARYLDRIYTAAEQADADGPVSLAGRFAAKEAVTKVLRPTGAHPGWRSIEVCRRPGGWCEIRLHGEAARLAAAQGLTHWSVSLTHEGNIAAAVAAANVAVTKATEPATTASVSVRMNEMHEEGAAAWMT